MQRRYVPRYGSSRTRRKWPEVPTTALCLTWGFRLRRTVFPEGSRTLFGVEDRHRRGWKDAGTGYAPIASKCSMRSPRSELFLLAALRRRCGLEV